MTVVLTQPSAIQVTDSVYYENHYGAISVSAVGGTPDYTYEWSNGETNNVVNGLFSGDYWLTITDANGCTITNSYNIEVELIIPSVITPNNDGKNDKFRITNIASAKEVDIKIFNRWGDVIFEYSGTGIGYEDSSKQWDGTYNGKELPMGSYVYIIDLKNDEDPSTGTVTIVR
jgi:gliding motility-associated-like protein